jgi:HK97 family phage portal protein
MPSFYRPEPPRTVNPLTWIADRLSRRAISRWASDPSWGPSSLVAWGQTTAGVQVNPETALSLTVVFACINVIATDVSALPLKVYRRKRDGSRMEVRDHPLVDLLAVSPDDETTSMRWRQAMLGHVLGWGNSYAEIERDNGGRVMGLHLLSPHDVKPERVAQNGRLYYRYKGEKTIPRERMLHVAGLGFDGLKGYSPVEMARQAIGLAIAAERTGGALYGNGAMPKGVLEIPGALKDENAVNRLRSNWNAIHQGSDNAGSIAILEGGAKFTPTSINPEDAQFIATRKFQVEEICRLYRVPQNKVQAMDNAHLANIESSNLDYLMTTLTPWCEAMEQSMNFRLLTADERAAGYFIEHQTKALLRGDMRARAEYLTKMRDLGALSVNDICAEEGINPIGPDGDIRLVPLNMVSLEMAGKKPEPPAPAPPPTTSDPVEPDEDDTEDDTEEEPADA